MLLRVHAAGGDASKRHRVHGLWDVNERHGERAYWEAKFVSSVFNNNNVSF